jgi:dTDP-4-amino-4,6-dideoxygalactose transaminase
MDAIQTIAETFGIAVIEDAAHALPAVYKTRRIGSGGNLCMFSFYATKPLTTGEGGMITTDDDATAQRIRMMRLHGITRDVWDRYQSETPKWFYEVAAPGFKYNLPGSLAPSASSSSGKSIASTRDGRRSPSDTPRRSMSLRA